MASTQTIDAPREVKSAPGQTAKGKTRHIAVLFTDVVGSTRFFKSRGDAAGRKMLQQHLELASKPIKGQEGVLVKTIGDSVMAYFHLPLQAVRAAVEIQKALRRFNGQQSVDNRIQVRIGIHYGPGIVEEKDIFGNVVNLAAKVMPLVGGEQIFITDTVRDNLGDACPVPAELLDGHRQGTPLSGMALYNLIWHKEAAVTTAQGAFVLIKLCTALADKVFSDLWDRFKTGRQHIWAKRVLREEVQDASILLALGTVTEAVGLVGEILSFFHKGMPKNSGFPLIPVQIFIDKGTYRRDQPLKLKTSMVDWSLLDPGNIHLTAAAAAELGGKSAYPLQPVGPAGQDAVQVLITTLTHGKGTGKRFLYQGWPRGGHFLQCFYCGDRQHRAKDCPSKAADPHPTAMNRMGYRTLEKINQAFFSWLTANPAIQMVSHETARSELPALEAFRCFCDLGFNFQLRFFALLWGGGQQEWEAVRKGHKRNSRGGPVWLALDCLRTGNHVQAEYLIDSAMSRYGMDYRTHCTLGLVHMEQGNSAKAEMAFAQAQDLTQTESEQIFVSLLNFRLLEVFGDEIRAEKAIRRLRSRHPRCPDVQFHALRFKFRDSLDRKAMDELVRLIQDHRRFYLHAMMAPELAPFSSKIQHELGKLFVRAKKEQETIFPVAEAEIRRFQDIFGESDAEVVREKSLLDHARELGQSGSYFGQLDAAETARSVVARIQGTIQNRKRGVTRTLRDLEMRCTRLVEDAKSFADAKALRKLLGDAGSIYAEVVEMKEMARTEQPEIFNSIFERGDELAQRLDEIAKTLKRMADLREIRRFLMAFFNKSLIFQSINLLIGIVLFPLVNHYLGFIFPQLRISDYYLVFYQKVFLGVGGLIGVMLALLRTAKSLYPR